MRVLFAIPLCLLCLFSCLFAMMSRVVSKSLSLSRFSLSLIVNPTKRFASRSSFLPTDFLTSNESDRANRCAEFIDASPDPFHCVQTVKTQLDAKGFTQLDEAAVWANGRALYPGGKYYFIRYGSSIVAFTIGKQYKRGNAFKIMGAHTDSPNLRVKPNSKRSLPGAGVVQLTIEPYGGGLWHTWLDRDLSLSGRVIVRRKGVSYSPSEASSIAPTPTPTPQLEVQLVKIDSPILRIPNLCIHLRTAEEREAFKVNKEDQLVPILTQYVEEMLNALSPSHTHTPSLSSLSSPSPWHKNQDSKLLTLLAQHCKCNVDEIADFELSVYDVQKATRTGMYTHTHIYTHIIPIPIPHTKDCAASSWHPLDWITWLPASCSLRP